MMIDICVEDYPFKYIVKIDLTDEQLEALLKTREIYCKLSESLVTSRKIIEGFTINISDGGENARNKI